MITCAFLWSILSIRPTRTRSCTYIWEVSLDSELKWHTVLFFPALLSFLLFYLLVCRLSFLFIHSTDILLSASSVASSAGFAGLVCPCLGGAELDSCRQRQRKSIKMEIKPVKDPKRTGGERAVGEAVLRAGAALPGDQGWSASWKGCPWWPQQAGEGRLRASFCKSCTLAGLHSCPGYPQVRSPQQDPH